MDILINDIFILNNKKNTKYNRNCRAVKVLSITKTHVYVKFLFSNCASNLSLNYFLTDYCKINTDIFNLFNNKVNELFDLCNIKTEEEIKEIYNLINHIENDYYIKLSTNGENLICKDLLDILNFDSNSFLLNFKNLNNLFVNID